MSEQIISDARRLYEELSEDQMDYFEAFGIEPEEA